MLNKNHNVTSRVDQMVATEQKSDRVPRCAPSGATRARIQVSNFAGRTITLRIVTPPGGQITASAYSDGSITDPFNIALCGLGPGQLVSKSEATDIEACNDRNQSKRSAMHRMAAGGCPFRKVSDHLGAGPHALSTSIKQFAHPTSKACNGQASKPEW